MTTPSAVPDVRLVITGHDAEDRGSVVADSTIGPKAGLAADGWQAYVLWAAGALPTLPDDGLSAIDTAVSGVGSVRLVQCVVYPEGRQAPTGDAMVLQAIERAPGDNSAMHFTRTVDLVTVIDGEVDVVLDSGTTTLRQGDFLVQNGTRHEWRNRGDKPARLSVVVLGTEHRGFG
jgi:quercetin dioxygenase-like cupin family protein